MIPRKSSTKLENLFQDDFKGVRFMDLLTKRKKKGENFHFFFLNNFAGDLSA